MARVLGLYTDINRSRRQMRLRLDIGQHMWVKEERRDLSEEHQ
jgi:hypothetical protein